MQNGLGQIVRYARRFCTGLRITQVDNFVRLRVALWPTRTTVLSRLALAFEGPRRHAHRLKRLWRFLCTPRFPAQAVMDKVALHNLAAALQAGARKVVLADVTKVTDQLGILAAAIPAGGRAVPVMLRAYRPQFLLRSLNTLTHDMLAHLKTLLGPFVVVGDRAFGHAWTIRACRQLGLDFVLRIQDRTIIKAGARKAYAQAFVPRRGRLFYPNARYGRDWQLKVNLIAIAAKDPWLLVTSLRDLPHACNLYEQRMRIEQTFRDMKTLLGLKYACLRSPHRLQALLVALMLLYSVLLWLGLTAARSPVAAKLVASGSARVSFVYLALTLIQTSPSILPFFAPHAPTRSTVAKPQARANFPVHALHGTGHL